MAPPPLNGKGRDRNRTVAAVSGLFALAGLGYYLYTTFAASNENVSREGGKNVGGSKKKNGSRPSLSISLPPTFIRSPTNLRLVETILTTLSNQYIITLILPPLHSSNDERNSSDHLSFEGLDQLTQEFQHIEGFDTRRILEYSKEEGRISLARALACDAHCEVMLEQSENGEEDGFPLFDNEGSEDGDQTPRAIPVTIKGKSPTNGNEEEIIGNLERYHAEVARIRKSSGLLIFLILPISSSLKMYKSAVNGISSNSTSNKGSIWSLPAENILKPFLMVGQKDLSARVPGVKIIDCRTANDKREQQKKKQEIEGSSISKAWSEGAKRIAHLANGWS